jgi:hypothetical protein
MLVKLGGSKKLNEKRSKNVRRKSGEEVLSEEQRQCRVRYRGLVVRLLATVKM